MPGLRWGEMTALNILKQKGRGWEGCCGPFSRPRSLEAGGLRGKLGELAGGLAGMAEGE
ncbi:MAG: hypothetical protein K6T66_14925 [Peptococcaceae bacterium]|nr:hypothetical protein [Peptococcaceae bacterium]